MAPEIMIEINESFILKMTLLKCPFRPYTKKYLYYISNLYSAVLLVVIIDEMQQQRLFQNTLHVFIGPDVL